MAQGSSCAFHKIVITSLVPRHVSRQYTQHFDLILTVLHFSFAHRLRLKVDHVRKTLRRFTRPKRWLFLRIQNLARAVSPAGLSTTRSSLSKRLSTLLKRGRFQKLRTSSLYPTTSHFCLRLFQTKALLCLKKQTWTTSKLVLCWLHHGIGRSEKQARNDHTFITVRLFGHQADPKTLYVYTDTDWATDELTRRSVSRTVERCGSHMLDCSVAKQSLVALSSGEAEFYGVARAVAT